MKLRIKQGQSSIKPKNSNKKTKKKKKKNLRVKLSTTAAEEEAKINQTKKNKKLVNLDQSIYIPNKNSTFQTNAKLFLQFSVTLLHLIQHRLSSLGFSLAAVSRRYLISFGFSFHEVYVDGFLISRN